MIYLQITTGRGPAECSLALHHLSRQILAEGPGARLVRSTPYSSIVSLDGEHADSYARSWVGTIRWICEDPLTTNRKRKNWYLGIQMVDLPDPGRIEIHDDDLHWETKRASGKGGQHVNTTDSSVRLTHVPTGVVVVAQDERSQPQNKKIALERLKRALQDKQQVQMALLEKANWNQHNQLERGNAIRTFVGLDFDER